MTEFEEKITDGYTLGHAAQSIESIYENLIEFNKSHPITAIEECTEKYLKELNDISKKIHKLHKKIISIKI